MGDGGPQITCSSPELEGCIHLSKLRAAPRGLGISTRQIHSRFAILLFYLTEFCFVDRLNLALLKESRATSRLQEIFRVVRVFTAGPLVRCNESHYRGGFNWQYEDQVPTVLMAVNKLWITVGL
jgi:hypothetical protein